MDCPICGFKVANQLGLAAHFRHQSSSHPNYVSWLEDRRFDNKTEGEDYVRCRECGHRADTLARHIKASHGITADTYKVKYPDALIRASRVQDRMSLAATARDGGHGKGDTKTIQCSSCGDAWTGSKFLVPSTHDLRCDKCRSKDEVVDGTLRWLGKSEPEDFVSCLECDYKAENLTSHMQNAHQGYRGRHPEALLVALNSAVRDKTALQGSVLSEATKQRMSENAGRWNLGLTKTNDPRLAAASEKMLGRPSWYRGFTLDDPRIAEIVRKLHFYTGGDRPWDNGLAANLTLSDFSSFMDSEGRVDHHRVIEATGISWVTVRKYIVDLGLQETLRYIEDAAENRTVRVDKEILEQFKLGNGKVSIGKAIVTLGYGYTIIKRECDRHGLPTFHRHIRQDLCMETVALALGGAI